MQLWMEDNDKDDLYRCDVCLSKEESDFDKIVFCDGCNVGVH